jgi:hypothetical protein
MLEHLSQHASSLIAEVVIIDQNHAEPEISLRSDLKTRVLRLGPHSEWLDFWGHDHPAVLQDAIEEIEFKGSHVLLLDSDCLILSGSWANLLQENTPALAADPNKPGLTHPCFMLIPVARLKEIDFREGIFDKGNDTGRLVGRQLSSKGAAPNILTARKAPWGRGDFYADGAIYHHGSGTIWRPKQAEGLHELVMMSIEKHLRSKVERRRLRWEFRDLRLWVLRVVAHMLSEAGMGRLRL